MDAAVTPGTPSSRLFSPLALRGVTLKNRIVISPMQQYASDDGGEPAAWHFEHLVRLAQGGAGLVFTEVAAIDPIGRNTHFDLGLWSDTQTASWARLARKIAAAGSVPGIQIGHCGRKASVQAPWDGFGPLGPEDAANGEPPWNVVGPSPIAANPGWPVPAELTIAQIGDLVTAYGDAARRAAEAGFQAIDIHAAHGYLIHSFLSPISNHRQDAYGGDRANRMRFALEVTRAVRANWPDHLPIFVRISAIDGMPEGWDIDDSIALARELSLAGVDVIDCSSGGLTSRSTTAAIQRPQGYQVPLSAKVRAGAGLTTMAVGLIRQPAYAESVLQDGDADLIAIGRESLHNPFWPLHAAVELLGEAGYAHWPPRYGWWLERRLGQLSPENAPRHR
ncbi:NADH:flavin oxidoreductase/NADH oxidase [Pseudohoeflea coraliihabitans]|uniref:NADH:flavin oxidoreductase/NADH oxidase n=1 Tax=Pseudohoeflea coraliihabitans TaxID=2860393 RepID=A0ABS6WR48_9HYPH|nr:NADH:flavin oxidoreductase/NADH oxidase [Pseudohoeflea sp. DP4N28-3]MBW3098428.1 NADH:flavin oxidoreductase/NADH oxidase [Pseudohoeflea sp. DP4N28-3]